MKSQEEMKKFGDKLAIEGLFQIGKNYFEGTNGFEKNLTEAARFFEVSSDKGHEEASYYLGRCFEKGLGVDISLERAAELYERANKKPVPLEMYWSRPAWLADMPMSLDRVFRNLGDQYKYGQNGKSKNLVLAAQYYCRAPLSANYQLYEIGLIFENNGDLKFASECYYQAKYIGRVEESRVIRKLADPKIQCALGVTFLRGGQFLSKNQKNAFAWIEKAAMQNHPEAEFQLAMMYEEGEVVLKNQDQAVIWFARAWQHGNPSVTSYLVNIFNYKSSTPLLPINEKEAIEYFRQRALEGHPSAYLIKIFDMPSDSPLLLFSKKSGSSAAARVQPGIQQLPPMLPIPSEAPSRRGMLPPLSESLIRRLH